MIEHIQDIFITAFEIILSMKNYYFSKTHFHEFVQQAKKEGYKHNMMDRLYVKGPEGQREYEFTHDSQSSNYLIDYPDAIVVYESNSEVEIKNGQPYYYYSENEEH